MLRYGWLVVLPLLAAMVVGLTVDVRWFIVGLAMLFICIPMLLSMIYFYYMLTPEARRAVALKQVEFSPGSDIKIEYLRKGKDDEPAEIISEETIPQSQVHSVNNFGNYFLIRLKADRITILLIPKSQTN